MVNNNLDPSNIIQVSLLGTPVGLAIPNINTIALISQEVPVWDGVQNFAQYTNATQVAQDFGSNSLAYKIANAIFSQQPNPIQTQGYLVIIPRLQSVAVKASIQIQDLNYEAVASGVGGNDITIAYTTGGTAGEEAVSVVGAAVSVQIASGISTADQIKAAIEASVSASALVAVSVFGVGSNAQTAPVGATNLAGGSASGLEPVHTAMIRTINEVSYFGVVVDFIPTSPFVTLPAYISGQSMMGFFASNSKPDFAANGVLGSFAASGLTNSRGLYYNDGVTNDTIAFAAGYASRLLSTNFSGSKTTVTMNLKQLVGFNPDTTLTQTDLLTCAATGVDVYGPFGFQGLVPTGRLYTSGANLYADQVYNRFWLKMAIQVAGFNYLAQTNYKIPQTNEGMDGLKNAYIKVLAQAVANGMLAPGSWNSPDTFGDPSSLVRNVSSLGYYIYSQPISQQAQSDRELRKAPVIQVAAKEAGAIHSSSIIVNVNP